MRAVWFRSRAELWARWRSWAGLALLVGVFGGVVLVALRVPGAPRPPIPLWCARPSPSSRPWASSDQVSAAVAWQATVMAAIAVVVGVALGVVAGRRLWDLFAHQLGVAAQPRAIVLRSE